MKIYRNQAGGKDVVLHLNENEAITLHQLVGRALDSSKKALVKGGRQHRTGINLLRDLNITPPPPKV